MLQNNIPDYYVDILTYSLIIIPAVSFFKQYLGGSWENAGKGIIPRRKYTTKDSLTFMTV